MLEPYTPPESPAAQEDGATELEPAEVWARRIGLSEMVAMAPLTVLVSVVASFRDGSSMAIFITTMSIPACVVFFLVPGFALWRFPKWGWLGQPLALLGLVYLWFWAAVASGKMTDL